MNEYEKLKHSYSGSYREKTFSEKHSGLMFFLAVVKILAVLFVGNLIAWGIYSVVAPAIGLPALGFGTFWLIRMLLNM